MFSGIGPLSALLLGAAILLAGNGLQGILLPVRAGLEAFTPTAIGLIAAAYAAGFVLGCIGTPHLVKRVGHIRTFAALAAIAAAIVLVQALVVSAAAWIPLRALSGACFAGLFMVVESWLNECASNRDRGRIFAIYMIVNLAAVTLGQMLLPLGDPGGFELFAVTAIAITLALVPVALTTSTVPRPLTAVRLRLRHLYAMSPVGVVGCFFVGLANGAFAGFGAVFAQTAGLSVTGIALFMSAAFVGGALAQLPLGRLSDRIDRRKVIALACALAAAAGVAMAFVGDSRAGVHVLPLVPALAVASPAMVIGLVLLYGGFAYPLYSLCVAHANDFAGEADFVEVSSGLLLTWAIGAAIGPLIASVLMESLGLAGLFIHTAAFHLAFGVFALYRVTRTAPIPAEERTGHVYQPGATRTTPAVSVLDPRAPEAPAPDSGEHEPEAAAA